VPMAVNMVVESLAMMIACGTKLWFGTVEMN
jgi:hypothetical protein